jgi:DNA-binding MarR family transcriptional regulator
MNPRENLLGGAVSLLSICYQHLGARFHRVLEPLDLNMTRMSVLTHFSHQPDSPETITSLVDKMEMNQPVLTKSVKVMQTKGWIDRLRDEDDGRVWHLFVTARGLACLSEGQRACLPIMQEAFDGLSDDELKQLLGLLSKLKNGVESREV